MENKQSPCPDGITCGHNELLKICAGRTLQNRDFSLN